MDLRSAPFNLDDAAVKWVEETLAGMDADAKLGQLFCMLAYDSTPETLDNFAENLRVGGLMLRPMPAEERATVVRHLQERSKIPFLIAGNLEAGSSPTVAEGTYTGNNMMLGATGDPEVARRAGHVIGKEARAAGVNWAFAPVIDLDLNWRNPITGTRTFGSDTAAVAAMGAAWVEAVEAEGVATSSKHFPGDGVDERDQHLVASVNTMTPEEWDATYGEVYRAAIAAGTKTIMAGHIMLPEYSKALRPGLADNECLPGSLAPELLGDLLRGRLGFNGLIVS
ncbi:MAG: glycoside hydrolase family 3 protein, partial [Promicromonosporaceae bacterium]|nr:glycoside hydrolase family 3 protein [Promicromonosporaceae bacterium]